MDTTLRNLLAAYLEGEKDAAGPLRDWLLERGEEGAADMVVPDEMTGYRLISQLVGCRFLSHWRLGLALAPWLYQKTALREVKKLLRRATGKEWSVRSYATGFVVTKPTHYWRRRMTCQVPLVTPEEQELMTVLLCKPCLPFMATVCGETAALRRELILRLRAVCARLNHPGKA